MDLNTCYTSVLWRRARAWRHEDSNDVTENIINKKGMNMNEEGVGVLWLVRLFDDLMNINEVCSDWSVFEHALWKAVHDTVHDIFSSLYFNHFSYRALYHAQFRGCMLHLSQQANFVSHSSENTISVQIIP